MCELTPELNEEMKGNKDETASSCERNNFDYADALHEAGHIVVGLLLGDTFQSATIKPKGETKSRQSYDEPTPEKEAMRNVAGFVAEHFRTDGIKPKLGGTDAKKYKLVEAELLQIAEYAGLSSEEIIGAICRKVEPLIMKNAALVRAIADHLYKHTTLSREELDEILKWFPEFHYPMPTA